MVKSNHELVTSVDCIPFLYGKIDAIGISGVSIKSKMK